VLNQPTGYDDLDNGNVYLQAASFYGNEERLVSQALAVAAIPGAVLQAEVRPNLPMVHPFPPLFGYPDYQDRQWSVDTVLNFPRAYRNRQDDISGGVAGIQAGARNTNEGIF
jgi:hypothetical protein